MIWGIRTYVRGVAVLPNFQSTPLAYSSSYLTGEDTGVASAARDGEIMTATASETPAAIFHGLAISNIGAS